MTGHIDVVGVIADHLEELVYGFTVHLFTGFGRELPEPLCRDFRSGMVRLHPYTVQMLRKGRLLLIECRRTGVEVRNEDGEGDALLFVIPTRVEPVQSGDYIARNGFQAGEHPFEAIGL